MTFDRLIWYANNYPTALMLVITLALLWRQSKRTDELIDYLAPHLRRRRGK